MNCYTCGKELPVWEDGTINAEESIKHPGQAVCAKCLMAEMDEWHKKYSRAAAEDEAIPSLSPCPFCGYKFTELTGQTIHCAGCGCTFVFPINGERWKHRMAEAFNKRIIFITERK